MDSQPWRLGCCGGSWELKKAIKMQGIWRDWWHGIHRGEEWSESWALKVGANIKFSLREVVLGCFMWKQWSGSKCGTRLTWGPPMINYMCDWSRPGRRHLKWHEGSRPLLDFQSCEIKVRPHSIKGQDENKVREPSRLQENRDTRLTAEEGTLRRFLISASISSFLRLQK